MGLTRAALSMAAAAVGIAGGGLVAYDLTVRYGRLLLEVEALRAQVARGERRIAALTRDHATSLPSLPPGMVLSDFELPDLDGNRVTLSEWQGRTLLLIFVDPRCGYSREMLPALAALPELDLPDRPMPLLVSRGDAELNRRLMQAHGVRCPVLLQEDREVAALFSVVASPSGYLVDERGRTRTSLLVGPDALLEHAVGHVVSSLAEQSPFAPSEPGRAPRLYTRWSTGPVVTWNGLRVGTPAPDFRLPSLDGGELSLSAYRGRSVLLVFWDPECGPCDGIAADIQAIQRRSSDLQVIMVSRGDPDANRRNAARHGLTVPIGLQSDWSISRAYQLLGAPIAYLIDAQGVITADVAAGQVAIKALLAAEGFGSPRDGACHHDGEVLTGRV